MVSMTLAVPFELKQKMESFSEINWSEVARQAFVQKIKDLEILRKFKLEGNQTSEGDLLLGKE